MAMNNSLAEVHPELVLEWSEKNLPLTPDNITFGSNKKVWTDADLFTHRVCPALYEREYKQSKKHQEIFTGSSV